MLTLVSSPKKALGIFLLWWLLWSLLHSWVIRAAGFSWEIASLDSALSNILLAGICFAMSNTLRYYNPGSLRSLNLLPWAFALAVAWIWLCEWLLIQCIPDTDYQLFLHRSLIIRFCIAFLSIGCFLLLSWIGTSLRSRKEEEKRQLQTEQLATAAELTMLRQQLQPHFLFNSLNSISALIGSRPEEARKMIQQLSDFLRGTLKKEEQSFVSLDEELQHLSLYLDIEKVRFGHRLQTDIRISEAAKSATIPALLLQPLVENAIKFGLYDTLDEVLICIDARMDGNNLFIAVSNPFDVATAQPRSGTGFGLSSISRRLYLLYGRQDLLQTKAEADFFTSTLLIPQQNAS